MTRLKPTLGQGVILCCLLTTSALAHVVARRTELRLHESEALSQPAVIIAERVEARGEALDDVFLVANEVHWSGRAVNDVWILGGTVQLSGFVGDHARVAGRSVQIGARIRNGLWVTAATVHLAEDARITGGTSIRADHVHLGGWIEGPVKIVGREVTLGGTLVGDVRVEAQELRARPDLKIIGDLIYRSPVEFMPDPRVRIEGEKVRLPVLSMTGMDRIASWVLLYLASLVLGVPILVLFPEVVGSASRQIRHSFWWTMATGALLLVLLPSAGVIGLMSYVGIPLAAVLLLATMLLLCVAPFGVAMTVGSVVLRKRGRRRIGDAVGILSMGLALLHLAAAIPRVGGWVIAGVLVLGSGAMARGLWKTLRTKGTGVPNDGAGSRGGPSRP